MWCHCCFYLIWCGSRCNVSSLRPITPICGKKSSGCLTVYITLESDYVLARLLWGFFFNMPEKRSTYWHPLNRNVQTLSSCGVWHHHAEKIQIAEYLQTVRDSWRSYGGLFITTLMKICSLDEGFPWPKPSQWPFYQCGSWNPLSTFFKIKPELKTTAYTTDCGDTFKKVKLYSFQKKGAHSPAGDDYIRLYYTLHQRVFWLSCVRRNRKTHLRGDEV